MLSIITHRILTALMFLLCWNGLNCQWKIQKCAARMGMMMLMDAWVVYKRVGQDMASKTSRQGRCPGEWSQQVTQASILGLSLAFCVPKTRNAQRGTEQRVFKTNGKSIANDTYGQPVSCTAKPTRRVRRILCQHYVSHKR